MTVPMFPHLHLRLRTAGLALAAALVMACASAGQGGSQSPGASRDTITSADLSASTASNVYDAINAIRPRILNGRGRGAPDVYIGGVRQSSGLQRLRELPLSGVAEVRYLPFEEARQLAGERAEGGAIVVTMR